MEPTKTFDAVFFLFGLAFLILAYFFSLELKKPLFWHDKLQTLLITMAIGFAGLWCLNLSNLWDLLF